MLSNPDCLIESVYGIERTQCEFCKGRGCVDQIFSLRILVEKAREFNTPLCISFVDHCKAYDFVSRETFWACFEEETTTWFS